MMQGIVDQTCEATIRLVVRNTGLQRQTSDAAIDTGFTGFLTLPVSVLTILNLQAYRREEGVLGDGSICIFDVYRGLVNWDGEWRQIDINASESVPLVGMALLYGFKLQIEIVEGGIVTIEKLQ